MATALTCMELLESTKDTHTVVYGVNQKRRFEFSRHFVRMARDFRPGTPSFIRVTSSRSPTRNYCIFIRTLLV